MIKTILVPTDGSEIAGKAVDLASDLAAKYQARMVLLHVLLSGTSFEELRHLIEVDKLSPDAQEEFKRDTVAEKASHVAAVTYNPLLISRDALTEIGGQILEAAKRVAESKSVGEVTLATEDGDPAKTILNYAKEHDVDMIVMGNRGLGALEELLVGSVSHKVNHHAKCSVITVR
jgi:nucleotide-binding universal stress UspA family protein